ncbi:ornithine cyclodeaminase [Sphaerotilus microaerophilus]|uniref:Ornithine cyclodeaminase n=1 Tax=Sphaerotilus microaerophilus TaxID=2914710 RepID=A0ABM7YP66_9BURK|nr:ornithine cyclodeaminase [Sphaerotilus sp. FB-5]BDI06279.1 ornithine cyclodeaminase [Sphaerotilus sp. FB-5]
MRRLSYFPLARDICRTTRHLGTDDVVEWVRRVGLSPCIARVAERIESDFLRWADFDKSARVACHSSDGVIELMPIADAQHFAFKYVNGHPVNTRVGLPTVMAFGVLADVATGAPRLISELTVITAIRTAAMSAVAARALARPNCRTMALIGNGAQSEFQALAMRDALGICALRLFDVDPAATAKLVENLTGQGMAVTLCRSTAEALEGADIVTTVTADKQCATIVTPQMLSAGMHLNAVGGDCPGKTELHPQVLERGRVFVEYEPQTRIEGDVQQMPADFPVTELWRVLAGEVEGRRSADEVTVFDSVGFALEDFSALSVLYEAASLLGLGQDIDLVAAPANPKNLFGLLGGIPVIDARAVETTHAAARDTVPA